MAYDPERPISTLLEEKINRCRDLERELKSLSILERTCRRRLTHAQDHIAALEAFIRSHNLTPPGI